MASGDTREDILTQYLAIALAVKTADTTIVSAARNVGPREVTKRPAIVLLDGDETPFLQPPPSSRGGQVLAKTILIMTPELYILLEEVRPTLAQVGQRLNAYRDALIAAVAGDATLLELLGPNGKIQYRGCATDLKSGSAMAGEMRLDFAFTYVLNPTAT
jgi:hypothetical protein